MNKDEIKKALECCTNIDSCVECPYHIAECNSRLCEDALELITQQEKEIEYLKAQVEDVTNHADTFLEEANKFEAENKKLKIENKTLCDRVAKLHFDLNQTSAEMANTILQQKKKIVELEEQVEEERNEKWDAQDDLECYYDEMPEKIKQAKIDVLNRAMKRLLPYGKSDVIFPEMFEDFIKEVQNENWTY